MAKRASFLLALSLILFFAGPLLAHRFLTCFSCAPGDYGCCGRSCHGYPGGTIYVARFPARYQPLQTYCIKVGYYYGDSVEGFNCSVKVGWGSVNAGRLQAGYLTETYSCSSQTIDGVKLVARCDTCNFYWVAPDTGTDTVRLYLGGFQGIEGEWGRGTDFVLTSAESPSGVWEQVVSFPSSRFPFSVRPNPFSFHTSIPGYSSERFSLYDVSGRMVGAYKGDRIGEGLAPGVYFLRAEKGDRKPVRIVKVR